MFGDPILNESNFSIDIVTNTVPRCVTPFVWVNFFGFDDIRTSVFFRQLLPPGPLFDFSTVTFSSANQHQYCKFIEKHPFGAKNTPVGPLVRRYENQKTFPLVFPSSPVVSSARSAPKFSFFPWDFSSETVSERS